MKFTHDEMMRDLYEAKLNFKRDQLTMMEFREEKGLEKGLKIGREEGREQGLIKGKKKIIEKMAANNLSVDDIVRITGIEKKVVLGLLK